MIREKICTILGTRPEIIKMSSVIRAFERKRQRYFYGAKGVFFEQLGLPGAGPDLDVGSGRHGEQTGRMLAGIEDVFYKRWTVRKDYKVSI